MRRLPIGYLELTYIASTGTQRINTDFVPDNNTRVVMDLLYTGNENLSTAFGTWASGIKGAFGCLAANNKTNLVPYYGAQEILISADCSKRHVIDINKNVVKMNGVEMVTCTAETFDSVYPLLLCCFNNAGTVINMTAMRIYACQIWDNGNQVRDYVPCISPSKKVGLYDIINGRFYGNAGTGEFIAGDLVIDNDPEIPQKSLGMSFARRRLMATMMRKPKYAWAVYNVAYVRDEQTVTTGQAYMAGSRMVSLSYSVSVEGFTLNNPTYMNPFMLSAGRYIVDISSVGSQIISGQYLYEVTGSPVGGATANVPYKRYEVTTGRGTTELYRVSSNTLDYPVDGEQDGLWYVLVEGEV